MSKYVSGAGAEAYAVNRHGPDGALLLDPFFQHHIQEQVGDKNVVDIGTGAAPWAIYAADAGAAAVRGFDSSQPMLEQAQRAIASQPEDLARRLEVGFGAVKKLPVESESFDVALSLNVGCALPSFRSDDPEDGGTLSEHFTEMNRVLKPGGLAIVTAPTSLETVFTTAGDEEAKIAELREMVRTAQDDEELRNLVGALEGVLRATILGRGGELKVAERGDLSRGVKINRKIPGLVVPNFGHNTNEYEETLVESGFKIVDASKPKLTSSEAQTAGLSDNYSQQSPFATYLVKKVS